MTNNAVGMIDFAEIKRLANGQWQNLVAELGGCERDILDGRHWPCPRCGGRDRFRWDAARNFAICNQCFNSGNGDGIAAIAWLRGVPMREAALLLADRLGVPARTAAPKQSAGRNWPDVTSAADAEEFTKEYLMAWVATKPPITVGAARAFGVRACLWRGQQCFSFAGRNMDGIDEAVLLYRADGKKFPASKSLNERKNHLVKGSKESWLWPGPIDTIWNAGGFVKCEGLPDALAAFSVGLPHGWIPITNACGAKSVKKLDFSFVRGKPVIVIPDADMPGLDGAKRFACAFYDAGASEVRMAELPFTVHENNGLDLRDYLYGIDNA